MPAYRESQLPPSYRSSAQASEDVKNVTQQDRLDIDEKLRVAMTAIHSASLKLYNIAPRDKGSQLVSAQFLLEIVQTHLADVIAAVSLDGADDRDRKRKMEDTK